MLDVLREAGFSSAFWRPLGRRLLDTNRHDLDAIEANHLLQGEGRVQSCLEKIISGWIRDGENSWEKLVEAVCKGSDDGGGENVAHKIRQRVGLGMFSSISMAINQYSVVTLVSRWITQA